MTLEDLLALDFIDEPSEKEALLKRLPDPVLTATVHTANKGHFVSFFQSPSNPQEAYAVTSANDPIYKIHSSILQKLPRRAFDLQDKRLFGMETAEIGLLSVKTPTKSFTVVQQHGDWYWEDAPEKPMNQEEMKLFVSRVVDLPAEISISFTPDNLEEYGLAPPAISIKALDTKGRPRGHLALGYSGKGLVYAMGHGLPGVYQARSVIVSQIPTGDWISE